MFNIRLHHIATLVVAFGFAGPALSGLTFLGGSDSNSGPPTNTINADENDTICSSQRGEADIEWVTITQGDETFLQAQGTQGGPATLYCVSHDPESMIPATFENGENCELTGHIGPVKVTESTDANGVKTTTASGSIGKKNLRFSSTLTLTCPTIGSNAPELYGFPTVFRCSKGGSVCVEEADFTPKEITLYVPAQPDPHGGYLLEEGEFVRATVFTDNHGNSTPGSFLVHACHDNRSGTISCTGDAADGTTFIQKLSGADAGYIDYTGTVSWTPSTLNVSNNPATNVATVTFVPCANGVEVDTANIDLDSLVILGESTDNQGDYYTYPISDADYVGVDTTCYDRPIIQGKALRSDIIDAYNLTTEGASFTITTQGSIIDPGGKGGTSRFTAGYDWVTN